MQCPLFPIYGRFRIVYTHSHKRAPYAGSYSDSEVPMSKSYDPSGSNNQYVYDSALELNAVAWGKRKAAINGINPH